MKFRKIHAFFVFTALVVAALVCGIDFYLRNRSVNRYLEELKLTQIRLRKHHTEDPEEKSRLNETFNEYLKKLTDLRFYKYRTVTMEHVDYNTKDSIALAARLSKDLALEKGLFSYKPIKNQRLVINLWGKPDQIRLFLKTIYNYDKEVQGRIRAEKGRRAKVKYNLERMVSVLEKELPEVAKRDAKKRRKLQEDLEEIMNELVKLKYYANKKITFASIMYQSEGSTAINQELRKGLVSEKGFFVCKEGYFTFKKSKNNKLVIYIWATPERMKQMLKILAPYQKRDLAKAKKGSPGQESKPEIETEQEITDP